MNLFTQFYYYIKSKNYIIFCSNINRIYHIITTYNINFTKKKICFYFFLFSHHPVVTTSTTAEQQPDNNTSAKNFPRKSRKLDPGQDLTPDIVTWLPVLLTASNPGCQLTNETSKETSEAAAATTTSSTTAITTTLASASASKNKVKVDDQNGQKTLVEDGLVFRSPEMKRSLRRNKKKKLSKKSPRPRNTTTTASGAGGGGGCSSSSSDNNSEEASADSFCETLKRHRRKPNKK